MDFENVLEQGKHAAPRGLPRLGDGNDVETISQKGSIELNSSSARGRTKSSLRLKYEAEAQVIQRKLGSLDAIRAQLGLTQRKMAQLLLVDPSAWNRWTKGEDQAPPHIYRMLQWYLGLEGKYPALDVNFWLNTVPHVNDSMQDSRIEARLAEAQAFFHVKAQALEQKYASLETATRKRTIWIPILSALAGAAAGFAAALRFL